MSLFDKRAVAAAVRTEEDFSAALKSEVDVRRASARIARVCILLS